MSSNYEHYKKEIAEQVNCSFRRIYFMKSNSCDELSSCKECNKKFLDWLNQEYSPKSNENSVIDWDKVPKNTPVLVWEKNDKSIPQAKKRFFAKYMPYEPYPKFAVYANGANSWTHEGEYEEWSNCSLFLVDDMEKYMKKD